METYEFDSFSDLPPLPQEFVPYYSNFSSSSITPPLDSLPPFPLSDFTFSDHKDLLHLPQHHQVNSVPDSFFLDSSLSLLNLHHFTESTQQLFHNDVATTQFLHLPDLKSIEQTTTAVEESPPPTTKNQKQFLSLSPPLPVAKRHKKLHSSSSSSTTSDSPTSFHKIDTSVANKQKKISNKIRSLEKLMPWEKKMSLAMILEESHKYIKFLQSQIASLRWMPLESVYNTAGEIGESDLLKSLTRQQILQVLANSPGSRNALSTHGVCVFSYEQLLSLKSMSRNL